MTRLIAALLLLLAIPASSTLLAQEPTPFPWIEPIDALIRAEVAKQELVGLAVVVIDDGKIAWSRGYGFADRENAVPVDPTTTQFRWASISKPVTAVAALQLAEQGKLDLDADIRTYVPEFPDKGVKITARDLLRHQAGIVHYANGPVIKTERAYTDPHPFADVVTALDHFKESPLVNQPGEKFAYSTHGFILLSAVVERAGKQRFADQVKERIAGPLGMADFRPDYQWEEIPNRAAGYSRNAGVVRRRPPSEVHDVSWKLGGGGFTSPVLDLARFGAGLLQHRLVTEETERAMWTVNKPSDPKGAKPYGFGFFVIDHPDGRKIVGHDGSQEKTRTALMLDPKNRRGVAVMTNSEWCDAAKLAMTLLEQISQP
jgi:CubicO group peptidase (beta-lactamase class C family)